jgi:hypothetical protein
MRVKMRAGERRKLSRYVEENLGTLRISLVMGRMLRMVLPALAALAIMAGGQWLFEQYAPHVNGVLLAPVVAPLTGKIDVALTNFSKGYRQNGLIADILFPRVGVGKQTDKYWVFGRENQELTEQTKRAPGAIPQESRFTLSTDSYFADSRALQATIPMETSAGYEVGDLAQDSTQLLTSKILLDKELEAAGLATDAAVLTNNVTLAWGCTVEQRWDF